MASTLVTSCTALPPKGCFALGRPGVTESGCMTGRVQRAIDGAIAQVTLSHPSKLNAMSRATWRALRDVFSGLQQRSDVRCVVLRGEGASFCEGVTSPSTRISVLSKPPCATSTRTRSGPACRPCLTATCPSLRRSTATAWWRVWKLPVAAISGLPAVKRALVRRLPGSAFPWRRARRRASCAPWVS